MNGALHHNAVRNAPTSLANAPLTFEAAAPVQVINEFVRRAKQLCKESASVICTCQIVAPSALVYKADFLSSVARVIKGVKGSNFPIVGVRWDFAKQRGVKRGADCGHYFVSRGKRELHC